MYNLEFPLNILQFTYISSLLTLAKWKESFYCKQGKSLRHEQSAYIIFYL